jgi:dTDP-4-dehydrorhamnose 3,5-epimerase
MRIKSTKLDRLMLIEPDSIADKRGFFMEVYRADFFKKNGIPAEFVQENHSSSSSQILRGLHFQWEPKLGKLIRVIRGSAFAVAVDIRHNSPTLGQWYGIELSYENKKQIWAPAGFATGFCVLGKNADVEYHYTALYNQKGESNILWSDPKIGIDWPIKNPTISSRDSKAQTLEDWLKRPESNLF